MWNFVLESVSRKQVFYCYWLCLQILFGHQRKHIIIFSWVLFQSFGHASRSQLVIKVVKHRSTLHSTVIHIALDQVLVRNILHWARVSCEEVQGGRCLSALGCVSQRFLAGLALVVTSFELWDLVCCRSICRGNHLTRINSCLENIHLTCQLLVVSPVRQIWVVGLFFEASY